jgi:hypothetical protein
VQQTTQRTPEGETLVSIALTQQQAMDSAVRDLVTNHNPKGNKIG